MNEKYKKSKENKLAGFTLLEIIIVVIIIGVLASIALPNYNRTVERSRLAEAVNTLKIIKDAQSRYAAQTGDYAGSLTNLGNLDLNVTSSGKFFTFNVGLGSGANPDDGGDEVIGNATRNSLASGAGGYSAGYEIQVKESGNFSCSGSKCPGEFLP